MATRKEFICNDCGIKGTKTTPNYYNQLKKYGFHRCSDCGIKQGSATTSKILLKKYDTQGRNSDKIKIICKTCKKDRLVRKDTVKKAQRELVEHECYACSIKRKHQNNIYAESYQKRIGDIAFSKSVSDGVKSIITPEHRSILSEAAKTTWKIKGVILREYRKTEKYKAAMAAIWNAPGYKERMAAKSSEQFKKLWQTDEYRSKMLSIRSKQRQNISKPQQWLYDYLNDLNINYKSEHAIGPYLFDCFLPLYNTLIEVQGDYWHSLNKAISNDKAKASYIKNFTNHKIIYLFEHEFYTKDGVINYLKEELNLKSIPQVDFEFSSVTLKHVTASEINNFMYKYHYIGPSNHSTNLAFFINDKIIACCSFNSLTRTETATRLQVNIDTIKELSRFCIHPSYQKKNFASWCIAKSIKWLRKHNTSISTLIAFSDKTFGHSGTIYKASNWKYDGDTPPSYHYINKDGWAMHKKTLYNRAVKNSMTEKEFATKYEYTKIHTLPKSRFIYQIQ